MTYRLSTISRIKTLGISGGFCSQRGKIKNIDWKEITNDTLFLIGGCGVYIPVWIGQLIDSAVTRKDSKLITKIFRLDDAFTTPDDNLDFARCYSQIDPQVQSLIITNQARVQFLIHKETRGTMVSTMNVPLSSTAEGDYLLLLFLIEFMNREYPQSVKIIKDMGRELFEQFKSDPDVIHRPAQLRAYEITGNYLTKLLDFAEGYRDT